MTEELFKEEASKLISASESKIWLTRVRGHRLDFLCSAGGEQLKPIEKLGRSGEFILLGQQVPPELVQRLQQMLDEFAQANQTVDQEHPG